MSKSPTPGKNKKHARAASHGEASAPDAPEASGAGLVFAIHPAHVESVSWISGITDPLAALFYLPALLWYVRHRQEGGGLGGRGLALSIAFFALSLLCKETAIV